ncbi:T9SS type A sorting domain-containing protein [Flavobacteriaceae bacterium]|nr:T9SS type A sorting domain-containing protein [Flavobacteriaceae bacterium]
MKYYSSKRTTMFLLLILFVNVNFGQTRIKAMMYNVLNYSDSEVSRNKTPFLSTILGEVKPDLFMVCEMIDEIGSNYLFENSIIPFNENFQKAPFEENQSGSYSLQQMVYYNTKKLILEETRVITADTRDINQYTFKINTENGNTNPITIEVFVTHLKASTGSSNRQRRLNSIQSFVSYTNNIADDSYVLFAGDLNFYTSNEEGYQHLIDDRNPIVIIDPIDRPTPNFPDDGIDYYENYNSTYFWNNSSFRDIHSQSTRTSNIGFIDDSGSTGGLDDRFDFIMMSKNFNTSTSLYYVNDSYKVIGNNGNCYNSFISNPNCSGGYSQTLRDALIEFSDHLPIVMEIETPENTLSTNLISEINFIGSNIIKDYLKITSPNDINNLKIYSITGQLVDVKLSKNTGNDTIIIDVKHISKGIYYLSHQKLKKPLKFIKI